TNSTRIGDNQVADALRRIDNNILKLDSAIDGTVQRLDRPNSPDYSVERVISELSQFKETGIIQTMILRGEHDGNTIDNTTETEISALIDAYRQIRPRSIMLYSIDRKTPAERLHKVEADELKAIADRIMAETSIPVTTA
ncbi:MAG: radical SAM protein, partial [Muribaculaceae bacterium]|nr:radical SAM protein [Muribaculaceae bacterium]